MPQEITIHLFEASEGGFMYTIWLGDPLDATADDNGHDGGHCTGTIENALEMAMEQAITLLKSKKESQ